MTVDQWASRFKPARKINGLSDTRLTDSDWVYVRIHKWRIPEPLLSLKGMRGAVAP